MNHTFPSVNKGVLQDSGFTALPVAASLSVSVWWKRLALHSSLGEKCHPIKWRAHVCVRRWNQRDVCHLEVSRGWLHEDSDRRDASEAFPLNPH